MLRGRFGHTSKRPYIQGRLFIPRLEIWSDVSFLVDTGADKTTLLPADGSRMELKWDTLTASPIPSVGIGGISHSYMEESVLFPYRGWRSYAFSLCNFVASLKPRCWCLDVYANASSASLTLVPVYLFSPV